MNIEFEVIKYLFIFRMNEVSNVLRMCGKFSVS